jgi:hypothetical protein
VTSSRRRVVFGKAARLSASIHQRLRKGLSRH